jgi:hypothetical protein
MSTEADLTSRTGHAGLPADGDLTAQRHTRSLPAVKRTMTLLRSQAGIDDGDRLVLCGRRALHAQKA